MTDFSALLLAAEQGDGQELMDLLDYASNKSNQVYEKREAARLVWKRNAVRNGHPQISLLASRLFMRIEDFETEHRCLEVLGHFDIAPALHLLAAYKRQEGEIREACELALQSSKLNYLPGKSLYQLIRSESFPFGLGFVFWVQSRVTYKKSIFEMKKEKVHDLSSVWFRNKFDFSTWRKVDHSRALLSVLT